MDDLRTQPPRTTSSHDLHAQPPRMTSASDLRTQPPQTTSSHDLHAQPPRMTSASDLRTQPSHPTSTDDLLARSSCKTSAHDLRIQPLHPTSTHIVVLPTALQPRLVSHSLAAVDVDVELDLCEDGDECVGMQAGEVERVVGARGRRVSRPRMGSMWCRSGRCSTARGMRCCGSASRSWMWGLLTSRR
ncbi:hypothetical protein DFH08DRAFT_70001 [Mycena albidolilacea]|uniref:Uncharacterized protein n=1 Tax=Mycena albidolilacea TaxID=1033008 RepID=A0AAD7AB02_9AGAR|nr:hypothetical protein DFH08DRAFT_70001 [Mycena albidolilacea]